MYRRGRDERQVAVKQVTPRVRFDASVRVRVSVISLSSLLPLFPLSCGMRVALVEWLLLSRSAMIMSSYWSSFSEEAANVQLVPRVQVCAR
jgi:hypothetical protein